MRIFGIGITLLVLAIVLHNYFGGFTSRNQDSADHFAESAQRGVNESISEYEKNLQKSLEQAGAD